MRGLYETVVHYAELGDHRTGTDVDAATVNWLAGLLAESGADVTRQPYTFPKFDGHARCTDPAREVRLEPLYYSAVGDHREEEAFVTSIDFDDDHSDHAVAERLAAIVRQTQDARATLAVVATQSASGGLCAINRAPTTPGEVPICLAPGQAYDALCAAPVGVHFTAKVSTGHSENLSAYFPSKTADRPPLVVTTPLSGWFSCAGERGTGIAVAISICQDLSAHGPVLLVMPTGHELGYLGAAKFIEGLDHPVTGVLHLGSCIADKTALGQDGAMRAVSNLDGTAFNRVCSALASLNIKPDQPLTPTAPEEWVGESELWAPFNYPMISIAGTSETFHTPEDLPHNATTGELLDHVRSCVFCAAQALIR